MNKILLAAFLLFSQLTPAQQKSGPQIFAQTITPAALKKNLYIVAGRDMEGRETATAGQRKAAAYIESQFTRLGLLPGNFGSYQYTYPVYQDSLLNASIEVNGQRFSLDKDFNANLNNIAAKYGFSEAVYIGKNVTADSIKQFNLYGKLVIIYGENRMIGLRGRTSARLDALRTGNPAAILYADSAFPRKIAYSRNANMALSLFKRSFTPQQFSVSENIIKTILGSGYEKAWNQVSPKTFQSNILLSIEKTTKTLQSSNVIGLLPGTDLKDQYLFVTAHYDHLGKRDTVIYYGADDDGSGTVSVLQLAEAFAKAKAAGKGPRRTIVFMTVSGEEKGLWGSEYYTSHPVYPLDKTTADLNIDMIGRTDNRRTVGDSTNYVYIVGDDKLSSDLKPINEAQNKKYINLELDYKYNDPNDKERIYYRSDHYNFARTGVPIIFYTDGMLEPDYHKPTDTPDKINYNLMAKRAQLVFFTAWDMANRNDMLKRDIALPLLQRRGE
jgi:hypothetical protein